MEVGLIYGDDSPFSFGRLSVQLIRTRELREELIRRAVIVTGASSELQNMMVQLEELHNLVMGAQMNIPVIHLHRLNQVFPGLHDTLPLEIQNLRENVELVLSHIPPNPAERIEELNVEIAETVEKLLAMKLIVITERDGLPVLTEMVQSQGGLVGL